ncbi:hypothetical protein SAMN05216550_107267 [Paraburkholderia tropica]|uniref:Uncharacterized protein n=1 Tax=Paraburkholderia tropica TaxID=92647 RepID=A0AAQ1GG06_9BURK|nr:hypothetical protein SAMN05216550_107267 [Paraburkholderia tropica]
MANTAGWEDSGHGLGWVWSRAPSSSSADDTGPIADQLNGFRGHDSALGPIITYGTKIGGKVPFSASLRWMPTIASKSRLNSTASVMATATLAF